MSLPWKNHKIDLKDVGNFVKSNGENETNSSLGGFLENRQQTQNKVIFYRKTFFVASSIYFLILLGIFDPSIIGVKFNENISSTNYFGFNNLLEFMTLLAPLAFSVLYFTLILALIHRSILNTVINKIQKKVYKKPEILHYLNFPFSSGLLISLLSGVSKNKLIIKFRQLSKHFEYVLYVAVILISSAVLASNFQSERNSNFTIIVSLLFTVIILINTWRTLYTYRKQKKRL